MSSSIEGLRSEPPLTHPAPTRSPSTVAARSCGCAATRSSASDKSPTTATPDSIAVIAPRSRPGASTRSTAQWAPSGRG
ncbi:chromosome segregation SMC domain protein [Mycobacterium xenopi 4042]|uniref:Chromosome segregation SMC domain protein n=1 Tax=Mycobacterium xenopi 4042 TaxID=1299334 RepID=X8E648_MYCXE|nr:chromosome segregation SMC domain protein [Mycobacterium xenopi 4042]